MAFDRGRRSSRRPRAAASERVTQAATADAFDRAYSRGITHHVAAPRQRAARHRPPQAPLAPSAPVALGGVVLTPDVQRPKAWVVVEGDTIAGITKSKPSGVHTIDTGGVIMPGMIDLHGHPEYNVFSAWEPPKRYVNRNAWRSSREYAAVVRDPWSRLTSGGTSSSLKTTMTRYAETRAAVTGVTAIQGASEVYPRANEALVRNVDLWIFGEQIARSTIDFDRLAPDDVTRLKQHIADGDVRAHYVHLAEGQHSNVAAVHEFERFAASGLMGEATVAIHCTALDRAHLGALRDAGGKLVWSPQSNLRLYAQTTDAAAALDVGLPMGLGADWLPSGSRSLLDEMRVARRVLAEQGHPLRARDLVGMVTRDAARIAALDGHLGTLAVGRPADLVVLQRHDDDGYESVLESDPSSVDLVMIAGDAVYGRPDWLTTPLVSPDDYESLLAWGRPMVLDTRLGSPEQEPDAVNPPALRLADMRKRLIARYPNVGPIVA
jgi:5-methylthioadenosine/S-adenosylhomocysteine deaminase